MIATLLKSYPVADTIYSLDFSIPESLNHTAGQYVNLTLPHDDVDSRGKERWFSVSSAPGRKSFQVTTKFIADSSSSFKRALFSMKSGDKITVSSSMGDFVMPIDVQRQLLFVAAGVGITPYLSMLKQLKDKPENRYIVMFYGAKKRTELIDIEGYRDLLKELRYFISEKGDVLSSHLIFDKSKSMSKPLIFLAGPEKMTEAFRDELVELGIKREDIVGDYFDGY